MKRRLWGWVSDALRRYFVAGILAFAPLGITIWAIAWIIQRLDNLLLPHLLSLLFPGLEEPPKLPLVGALFTLVVILLMGVVARHFFGGEFVRIWERLLSRVPVARNIYGGVKQLFEAIFSQSRHSRFRRVVLIEYPRKGIYAIAFTTGAARGRIQDATEGHMINCFLPTTPNPTSGFYLLVPEDQIIEVALSVEDAFKLIMSAGLVSPEEMPTLPRGREVEPAPVNPPATAS
ncbi:MAG: DUF502 domain-containing protein [Myxococcales bacterium]|nr:DUF502 domain-containing protein [Myxococcales bacterium]MDH5306940.1 DUF502 domain-containing protein [Myxococcales bacterium]MDH5566871.1 DUF502 domain-containing protein [Myxococcales bacterium]